ncbi:acetyltransferase [Flavobacterium sp. 20NA77.7]|uniref:Acetyltransferase n=1 Tax=Flavobacterium nakdongensis TaxID=3073563 RepID=A0ABY9RBF1_9FLAO|nr:acetyltransferase [Flavobacterium sp. 20NA77.7]WMW78577.1 acetyltransferase [Flavobacterium sp. 20NA77.7]
MLIIGAKGFAKEVLEIFKQKSELDNLYFYDDVNDDMGNILYGTFPVLKSLEEAQKLFLEIDPRFTIGIGNPILRYKLYKKFEEIGGKFTSVISPFAHIGSYGNTIEEGSNIMTNAILTNDIHVGKGGLINLSCTVGHDVLIDDFVELCPDVNISGNCKIGKFTFIGTNSTILPTIEIGSNVIVAAGSVVTRNIPDNCMVAGIPAVIKKELPPIE